MKRIMPVIIVIILILGVGGSIVWKLFSAKYSPTMDYLDYASEIGLKDGEYAITLDNKLLSDYRAVSIDGRVYIDMDLVTASLNTRFYWDGNENVFIYTDQSRMLIFTPDQQKYTVRTWKDSNWKDSSDGDEGYAVVRSKDGKRYVAAEYVKKNTQMDYAEYTDPNRIVIHKTWGDVQKVTTEKETPVRYKGGVKGEVLRLSEPGESMTLIEAYDDWYNVATDDGYIGWVSKKSVGDPQKLTTTAPDFTAPEYKSIHRDHKIDMAWHQVMSTAANSNVASVLKSSPGINVISPTWFYFSDTDGKVASTAGADYVKTCHDSGVEVWALFSNEFPSDKDRVFDSNKTDTVLAYTSKRAAAIKQLMGYVSDNDIDGINLDFELIQQNGSDDYIEFIRELSIACRANGIVFSVDNYVPQYTAYYNRREQGIVADYVVTMCYDETDAGSDTPGPTASNSFFSKGITDTVALVDKSKVIAGIPFFTRVWSTSKDGKVTSFACGMNDALGYLTNHGVKAQMQDSTGLNYGSYTSDKDNCLYEIWLQDATSVSDEMSMIKSNDIAGCAAWKIGFESGTDIWKTISANLK